MKPGIKLEGIKTFQYFVWVSYEFEIGNHSDFAPEVLYDLKNSHINSLTMAIGVGKRF